MTGSGLHAVQGTPAATGTQATAPAAIHTATATTAATPHAVAATAAVPSCPPNAYIALLACAAHWPEREALSFPLGGRRLGFAAWLEESQRLAAALRALGVGPGDRVALWAENRAEWAVSLVALAALGSVLVPVNTHFRGEELQHVLRHGQASVLLLSERFRNNAYLQIATEQRPELPALREIICFDNVKIPGVRCYADLVPEAAPGFVAAAAEPGALGSIQYTSGTTGRPKGAALSFGGMMLNAALTARRLALNEADRWTSIIPLFHCAGCIMNLMGCLAVGARYVGVPAFDAEAMMRVIQDERCTLLTGVPTSFVAMLQHPKRADYDLRSLRAGTCGGADCDPAVLERCAAEFPIPGLVQVYGQTEASTLIALDTPGSAERWHTTGPALDGTTVRITQADTRAPVPAGEIGQIEVQGPTVMLGYHGQPEETAATVDVEGWLQTGDLGFLRPDGRLVIAGGRLRDMIIRGGENIYPVEIENVLRAHPAVAEVAVFGEPDTYYGETVSACISLREPVADSALAAALGQHLQGRLAAFKHPARYYRIEQWPMTSSGKIRKRELREMAAARSLVPLP
jgi:fatty-acyl-CoA synthase